MKTLSEYKPFSVVAILLATVTIAGTLSTSAIMKALGYPDLDRYRWNEVSVWVRDNGFIVLILPVIWMVSVLAYDTKSFSPRSRAYSIASGILALILLVAFYSWTVFFSGRNHFPISIY